VFIEIIEDTQADVTIDEHKETVDLRNNDVDTGLEIDQESHLISNRNEDAVKVVQNENLISVIESNDIKIDNIEEAGLLEDEDKTENTTVFDEFNKLNELESLD
jgi:hypothetical protein